MNFPMKVRILLCVVVVVVVLSLYFFTNPVLWNVVAVTIHSSMAVVVRHMVLLDVSVWFD